ncbi:MAG: alpha/beta fold hydrolase [Polyangiaceae bacterium]
MLRRTGAALVAVALLLAVVHLTFRASVSYALAYAPNGGGLGPGASRPLPLPCDATELRVAVGPPAATLSAWVLTPKTTQIQRQTVILLHGVRLDKSSMLAHARSFVAAGHRAVVVDLRGHGHSTGTHLTYGTREAQDVSQLIDVLSKKHPEARFAVFGYSYGAAVAIRLGQIDPRISAVVSVAAFSSLRSVVTDYEKRYLPTAGRLIPDTWLDQAVGDAAATAAFDPEDTPLAAVARARTPMLLIHGLADTQVSPEHARKLHAAARDHAELVLLPRETHDSVLRDESGAIRAAAIAFLRRHSG